MADQTNTDIAALQADIKRLGADIAKITGAMRHSVTNGVAEAGFPSLNRSVARGANNAVIAFSLTAGPLLHIQDIATDTWSRFETETEREIALARARS